MIVEKYDKTTMSEYPFFNEKLKKIEKLCSYKLGNIIWSKKKDMYPSEYFIQIIMNIVIINDYIINPPLHLNYEDINHFKYIPLTYNKLLIIDALMIQGSFPRYSNDNKFIYSEHSGGIIIKDDKVINIIVSTQTDRIDPNDKTIFLPTNTKDLYKYPYLFHTHPNTKEYGGRLNEGIIYEFPSANDIYNFMKYHDEGKTQGSLIVAPEGSYFIRPIFLHKYNNLEKYFNKIVSFISKLEKIAINNIPNVNIHIPDNFHKYIGNNLIYIKMFNKFIKPLNIFIEYYPRIKINNEWCLREINLPFLF